MTRKPLAENTPATETGGDESIHHAGADILAQVMRLGQTRDLNWEPDDFPQILEHLLSSELAIELASLEDVTAQAASALARIDDRPLRTFRDLFEHPNPPDELFSWVKQYAKTKSDQRGGPLPKPIASVLYFASIVSSRLRCNKVLTKLDDAKILDGIQWALDQPWLEPTLVSLFQEGLLVYGHQV